MWHPHRASSQGSSKEAATVICTSCGATLVKRYEGQAKSAPFAWYWWCRCGHHVGGGEDAVQQQLESAALRWVRVNERFLETR